MDYNSKTEAHSTKYWSLRFLNFNVLLLKNEGIFYSNLLISNNNLNFFFSNLNKITLKKKISTKVFMKNKFNVKNLIRSLSKFSFDENKKIENSRVFFKNLFDINFLKKEKIYTKLKYSRVPQYDIVSGASAALLAGFLGFLICEKFGFELLDSGDFYFLFMYLVFLSFCLKLFTKLLSYESINWNILSLKWFIYYYLSLFNFIKFFFKFK